MLEADLPQELIDIVLDNLHDDQRSLRQCSLVCKAWVPRCRSYIFEHIYLKSEDVDRWRRMMEASPEYSNLVRSFTRSFLRRNVEVLRISSSPENNVIPFQMLSQFSNLLTIDARRFSLEGYPNDFLSLKLPSVKSLIVYSLTGESSHQILQFLSIFPGLSRLEISLHWRTSSTADATFPNLPKLKHLRMFINNNAGFEFGRLLTKFSATKALQYFHATTSTPEDGSLNGLIASCASTLTSLHIADTSQMTLERERSGINLTANTALRHFSLVPGIFLALCDSQWALSVIATAAHLNIQSLTIIAYLDTRGEPFEPFVNNFDWKQLDMLISGSGFLSLESLFVQVHCGDAHRAGIESMIAEYLPATQEKGVLHLTR